MGFLDRLLYPASDQDWALLEGVPSAERRLALLSLRDLMNQLVWGPVWLGRPVDLRSLPESSVLWHAAEPVSKVWERGLPTAFDRLGWKRRPPAMTLRFTEAVKILAEGFRAFQKEEASPSEYVLQWPQGINHETWWESETVQSSEFAPVRDLIAYWEKHLKRWAPTLLIHGSCATLDVVPGTSDLDTLVVLPDEVVRDPEALLACISDLIRSIRYLLRFNPYTHHGHMIITQAELCEARLATFPICIVEKGVTLGSTSHTIRMADSDVEHLFLFKVFSEFFERQMVRPEQIRSSFDLLWWCSSAVLLPVIFNQMKRMKSYWKPEGLLAVSEYLTEEEKDLVAYLTTLRDQMASYLPRIDKQNWTALHENVNPGVLALAQRATTPITGETLNVLELTAGRMAQARAMWERMSREAVDLFRQRCRSANEPQVCALALPRPYVVTERPTHREMTWYELTKAWILGRAETMHEVVGVYEYGHVGCPGLSDLDLLVVLRKNTYGSPALSVADLPAPLQPMMGHDPMYISEEVLGFFPLVFPIFGAQWLCGTGAGDIPATPQTWESMLPLLSVMVMSKYPVDLIYLSRLPELRAKTIWSYLHSFTHFQRFFSSLDFETPPALGEAVSVDRRVRDEFRAGDEPRTSEISEVLDLMFRATPEIADLLDKAWGKYCPNIPSTDPQVVLETPPLEFHQEWEAEELVRYSRERMLDLSPPCYPFPPNLGWFVRWLGQGTGPLSAAITSILNTEVSQEVKSQVDEAFATCELYRRSLNRFAEIETSQGRFVPKYIGIVDLHGLPPSS